MQVDGWKYELGEFNYHIYKMCYGRKDIISRDVVERNFLVENESSKMEGVREDPILYKDLLTLEVMTCSKEPAKQLLRGKYILVDN